MVKDKISLVNENGLKDNIQEPSGLKWLIFMSFGFTLLFAAFQTGSSAAGIVFKSYEKIHGTRTVLN